MRANAGGPLPGGAVGVYHLAAGGGDGCLGEPGRSAAAGAAVGVDDGVGWWGGGVELVGVAVGWVAGDDHAYASGGGGGAGGRAPGGAGVVRDGGASR